MLFCFADAAESVKDALSPGLSDIADTAQRKVQEAAGKLDEPSQGIAAAREAAAAFVSALLPVQPADAATLGSPNCVCCKTSALLLSL